MEPTPLILKDVFNDFKQLRDNSNRESNIRKACFDSEDFSYKANEGDKEDTANLFYKNFLIKLAKIHAQMVYFEEWKKNYDIIKLEDEGETINTYDKEKVQKINEDIKYGNDSIGSNLLNFVHYLVNEKRKEQRNQLIYYMNNFEGFFDKNFEKYRYEFFETPKDNKVLENEQNKDNKENKDNKDLKKRQSLEQQKEQENLNNDLAVVLQSHPRLYEEKIDKKIEREITKCDENSSPFKIIINYHDLIYLQNLEQKIGDHFIVLLQKNLNLFLSNPYLDKCLYLFYNKNREELIQQYGKNNEIYSLLLRKGISRHIYDKYYDLNFFEKMLKEKVPEHVFNLGNRIYEEKYNKDLFKQELNNIIVYDYECYAKLDERNQKTMLIFYYRCPKGRVYRKKKNYRYLSQPNFQAFSEIFSPEFKLETNPPSSGKDKKDGKDIKDTKDAKDKKEPAKKNINPEESKKGYRFIIDDKKKNDKNSKEDNESNNSPLYYADDIKIGVVGENTKYMFPSDDGIFIKKVLKNGIYNSPISYIRKDDLVFGIKVENKYNEFWLNFKDGLRLNISYKNEYNSFFKNNENPKPSNDGCVTTLTLNDGLIIQIEPNGDIIQKHFNNIKNINKEEEKNQNDFEEDEDDKENYRLITSKASIIKYMNSGEIKILYSSGNTSSIKEGKIYNINNKGQKIIKDSNTGEITEEEPVFFSEHYDPESLSRTIVREDNVKTIQYPDGSKIVLHNDGTNIYTSAIVKEICHYSIENNSFATVEIVYDEVKKRTQTTIAAGSTEALIGSDDLMNRTFDGRLSKIILPDKTLVFVYKEKQSTELFETYTYNTIVFIYKNDGDVIRISQSGDIVIVSSNERKKLNDEGMNKDFEKNEDIDYLFEVNGKPEERKGGIYTCELNKGKIWTKDKETNIFVQLANGDSKCKIEGTTITEMNEKTIDEIEPHSPRYEGDSYINPETRFSDPPKNFYEPRLFVVDNRNLEAKEYLTEGQIESFKRTMKKREKNVFYCKKQNNIDGSIIHQWTEKELPNKEKYKNIQNLENIVKMPNRYIPLSQTIFRSIYPEKEIFIMRTLKQTPAITNGIKENIESIDADFSKTVRNIKKVEIEKVDPNIIKMNRLIQRRYIMERLEKKVNEEKKDGDFVEYKSDYSDLNNNINNEEQNSKIKVEASNENINNQNKPENVKGNRYLNM